MSRESNYQYLNTEMTKIEIESQLKTLCPDLRLGIIQCKVETEENNAALWEVINTSIKKKTNELSIEKIRNLSTIKSSKQGYKTVGKHPSRYRLSAEALLRRIVNEKGLYKINNIVDLLNLVSIESGFSIGGYNADKITGDVKFGIGKKEEDYQGIGKGKLNIEFLPVFRDDIGAFGSPTSDSIRTSIDTECTNFLMIIISFQSEIDLPEAIELATNLLKQFGSATDIETSII